MKTTWTVIKSPIKYYGAKCNNFKFSFKERMTGKDVKNFMTDRISNVLALLFALYLLSSFYSLIRNIFYTI